MRRNRAARALPPDLRADRTSGGRPRLAPTALGDGASDPRLRHPGALAAAASSAEILIAEPEERADGDQREYRRPAPQRFCALTPATLFCTTCRYSQANTQVGEQHDGERDRAPEIAARERDADDREEQPVEEIALVHARREHEERHRRDRAAFEQRARRALLQVSPHDQRQRRRRRARFPRDIAARARAAEDIDWRRVRLPHRSANRPEIERVDAVVGIDVRAVRVALEQPANAATGLLGMERLDQDDAPARTRRRCRSPVAISRTRRRSRSTNANAEHQRQQHRGLRLDQQRIRRSDSHAPTIHTI